MMFVVAMLLLAYFGSYYGLLTPRGYPPLYRFGGRWAEAAFRPAWWIDRQVRPKEWDNIVDRITVQFE